MWVFVFMYLLRYAFQNETVSFFYALLHLDTLLKKMVHHFRQDG